MIDFKIKGTRLPDLTKEKNLEYRGSSWKHTEDNMVTYEPTYAVFKSNGYTTFRDEIYILTEYLDGRNSVFMYKESDIIKLAKEQGMIEEKFKLPEKWCIKIPDYKTGLFIIENFVPEQHWYKNQPNGVNYFCFVNTFFACWSQIPSKDYTEITFEQFKQYVLKENNMNKEIIGYKLIKPEYKDAAQQIMRNVPFSPDLHVTVPSLITSLKQAGVLDLWFEPIYKSTEKTLTLSNGKSVVLSKEKGIVVEGTSVSPRYLSNIKELYISSINDWKVELKDATYKIGCWDNVKLSDINLILETYKDMQ